MTKEQLAKEIANGLIETGIEGAYDTVVVSTAGDYPSIGVSCWEGPRADALLCSIPDGEYYAYRKYSELANHPYDLDGLKKKLGSPEGIAAQKEQLAKDCELYIDFLWDVKGLDAERSVIYSGMWCPTSHYVVQRFLERRIEWGYDVNDLQELHALFRDEYAKAAGVSEYSLGYANRARNTYNYVSSLDLSEYGVPPYGA